MASSLKDKQPKSASPPHRPEHTSLGAMQSESRLRALLTAMPDMALVFDEDGRYVEVFSREEGLLYQKAEQLRGRLLTEVFPPDQATMFLQLIRRALDGDEPQALEYLLRVPQGATWFEARAARLPVEGAGSRLVAIVARDITDRKRAEDETRLLLTLTRAINESPDSQLALMIALREVCEETGWTYGEVFFPGNDGNALKRLPMYHDATGGLHAFGDFSQKMTFRPNEGLPGRVWSSRAPEWIQDVSSVSESFFLRARIARELGLKAGLGVPIVNDDEVLAVLVFFMFEACDEDARLAQVVTAVASQLGSVLQRKRAEEEVKVHSDELASLTRRLADLQETERQHLARELHDVIGSNLNTLDLSLNLARKQLRKGATDLDSYFNESLSLVAEASASLATVVSDLRPPLMDQYGFFTALRSYCETYSTRTGLEVMVTGEETSLPLSPAAEIGLFRIAQEALNNVAKHAQATQVEVTYRREGENVRLIVADDGVGFDPRQREDSRGRASWGQITMRDRATALGGTCHVESAQGKGTRVVVEVTV